MSVYSVTPPPQMVRKFRSNFFDFLGMEPPTHCDSSRLPLLCVLPTISNAPDHTFLLDVNRNDFINLCVTGSCISWLEEQKNEIYKFVEKRWEDSPTPPPTPAFSMIINGECIEVLPSRALPKKLYLP